MDEVLSINPLQMCLSLESLTFMDWLTYSGESDRSLNVIRYLICGSNLNWLLKLNLIYETLWTWAGIGLLISMLGNLNWFHLTGLITLCY